MVMSMRIDDNSDVEVWAIPNARHIIYKQWITNE